ncbi:location of vulva defective 1-like isoform X2 [Oncorhynchus masou masou]|uniref:location of vulva defective 1-like isoform X2 n=1 Tax=Oncorhynchus masou masou TaxID=90313 RepID=UPI003182D40E
MAGSFFGKVILLLVYFLVEVTGEQQYGGLGREITLTPKVSGQPEDILWKHNGNKVVEFDRSQNVEYGRYKGRTILDWDSGALTIKGLTDADSGPYELEAVVRGKLQYSQHKVGVIDDVAQPSATCVVDTTTPENMDRTLLCSADLQPLTQFIWRSPEGSESPGPELFIPGGENQESIYTCVVKNPVSEKSAEFTLKDCYTEEGSSSVLNVVLPIVLLVLVAVLAFLLWYYWRKCKKPEAALTKSEEEKGLVEDTNQGNKDPEDDHSENTGNITSIPKGMVKERVEMINKQNADPNRKLQTEPAGIIVSPTKMTDTEHVQDKPNPGQQDLVTPDHTQAQQDLVTADPTPETAPGHTDSAGTTETAPGHTDSAGTTETAPGHTDSAGTTETAPGHTDSAGTTETAPGHTDSAGTTETAPGHTDSAGTTETAPGHTDSAGTTETAPGHTDSAGTTETAPGQTDSAGTTETAPGQTDSAGTTETAPGHTDSAGTTETAPGHTDSAGTTETAPGHTDSAGTTETAPGHTDSAGTTETAPGHTDSAGTTETAPGHTDSAGTTETAPGHTDSAGTTETAPGHTDSAGTTETAPGHTDSAGTTETAPGHTDSAGTTETAPGHTDSAGTTETAPGQTESAGTTPKLIPLNAETDKPNQDIGHKKALLDLNKPGLKQENELDQESDKPQEEITNLYTGDGKHESDSGT